MAVRGVVAAFVGLAACGGPDTDGRPPGQEPGPELAPATLAGHGVVQCLDPAARDARGPWSRRAAPEQVLSVPWTWGSGLIVGDIDGDDDLDVLIPTEQGLVMFVGDITGEIVEEAQRSFSPFATTFASGGSLADYDGDGDLDIYVTRITGYPAPAEADGRNILLRNEGGGVFSDVTDDAGVGACGIHHRTLEYSCFRSMTSSWGDYDQDGDLDLYVGNYGWVDDTPGTQQEEFLPAEPDFLYRNDGDGRFTDLSATLPPELHDGYTYAGGFHDLDGDHDLDLYTVNDFGSLYPNRVMWNEGGELVWNPADATGLEISMTGMGLGVGDLNDDGALDLGIPEWRGNFLLESHRDLGIWFDTTAQRGVEPDLERGQHVGWGGEFGDLDNDGDLDLTIQYGHLFTEKGMWVNAAVQPDGVYVNEPLPSTGATASGAEFMFVDRAAELGLADGGSERGGLLVDLDRDGYLDLLKRSLHGPETLYTSRCGDGGWLEVHLRQPETLNLFAVGARIEIEAGGRRWLRHVNAGGTSYATAGPPEAHFGLGDLDRVERIRVVWPDGATSEVVDVDTRQQVTITRDP